ncbi:MAG: hypothetical protein JWR72_2169 [Flavisolibacter sp.]|jgi:hypothetical protein|nr:hypothetical protein [Flavisolibacter sp.]
MKKTILFCSLLLTALIVHAQEVPKTLDDLKPFIGLDCSKLEKLMKKKGYIYEGKEEDDISGPYTWKSYTSEESDVIPICDNEKVVGVCYEDFTASDYAKILSYLKSNEYKKTVDSKGGLERVDLWVSRDDKWSVKVVYGVYSKEKPNNVTITTGIKWGFE